MNDNKLENLLADNMRRFGTKNLTESNNDATAEDDKDVKPESNDLI